MVLIHIVLAILAYYEYSENVGVEIQLDGPNHVPLWFLMTILLVGEPDGSSDGATWLSRRLTDKVKFKKDLERKNGKDNDHLLEFIHFREQ